jgi:nicotinamidase-related amidase
MAVALLVVDVQRELVQGLEAERRSAFLRTLSGLLERARAADVPVVYVRHQDDYLVAGTGDWQIADEIAPRATDRIVEKRYRDAFRETDLAEVLQRLGVDEIVVCGMQTEFCIDATVREGERRGYRVTLVGDGHATYAAGGLTEEQIRDHVNRVAHGDVAKIVAAVEMFGDLAPAQPAPH